MVSTFTTRHPIPRSPLIEHVDTTAHTLAFAMAILALYPDIHARIREEADSIWPHAHTDPSARSASSYKEDFPRLVIICMSKVIPNRTADAYTPRQTYTQAVFNEVLRHFPSEPYLPRIVGEDTILSGTKRDPNDPTGHTFNQPFSVPVSKGDNVIADIRGMHMNRKFPANFPETVTNKSSPQPHLTDSSLLGTYGGRI
jgi:hypothetical protein